MRETFLLVLLLYNSCRQAVNCAFFSSKPSSRLMKTRIGGHVTFPWNITLEKGNNLVLMKLEYSKTRSFETSSVRIAYRTGKDVKIDNDFKGRVSVENSGALTLRNVSLDDRGFYKCHVELDGGQPLWDKVQLLVGVPPVIQSFPSSDITLLEGDSVTITCRVFGVPTPEVKWYRKQGDSRQWKVVGEEESYAITAAVRSNAGYYQCYASNYMDDVKRTLKINVYERPRVTSFFHTAALDGTIIECEEVTFSCEASATTPPVDKFRIYRDKLLLVSVSKTGRFRIAEVRKEHEGRYYCVPENKHGVGFNRTTELRVIPAPDNCKKSTTTAPPNKMTRDRVPMTRSSQINGQSSTSSESSRSYGRHSGSQSLRPCTFVVALLWSLYITHSWAL